MPGSRYREVAVGVAGPPGVVTSWHPTSAAMAKARQAPVSAVPVSYMQGQHIRGVYEQAAKGLDYSRQIIATCEVLWSRAASGGGAPGAGGTATPAAVRHGRLH